MPPRRAAESRWEASCAWGEEGRWQCESGEEVGVEVSCVEVTTAAGVDVQPPI
ncbi:MAG: hypothetical protein ACKERG_01210 [Candidatus Hodgkinia cicadicola]